MDFSDYAGAREAEEFLKDRRILIADSSGTIRRSVSNVMTDLGAKINNIISCADYPSALNELMYRKPSIIITEYALGNHCGLSLMDKFIGVCPDPNERLFVVATSNGSETSVAEAAEEEVDSYVLKPFNSIVLGQYIIKSIRQKLFPSAYRETINQGKVNLREGNLDAALEVFQQAKILSDSPCLACYYTGFTYEKKKRLELARQNYEEGLTYNAIHYKCLSGLFDLLVRMNHNDDAYSVSRDLTSFYPMNSKRLVSLLHLAVKTGNFEDIQRYHDMYTQLDYRPDDIVKTVTAALLVAGKYYLKKNHMNEAQSVLSLAAFSSRRNPHVLLKIVMNLAEAGYMKPIRNFLERFNPEDQSSTEYRLAEVICDFSEQRFDQALIHGRHLLAEGTKIPALYKYLIKSNIKLGRIKASEELTLEALSLWPDRKQELLI